MTTDTSEKGLETLIVRHMTGLDGFLVTPGAAAKSPEPTGTGYFVGSPKDFDRAYALDVPQLFAFLLATQPETFKKLAMIDAGDPKDINRLKFLARLSTEIGKRGVIDVIRKGLDHGPLHFDLFYATPSVGNVKAQALHAQNRFSITRQLAYSSDETRRALDLCLFINGLPIASFELKNSLTKQTVEDAVEQYRRDRDSREKLFEFGRCVVHFAVDDSEVRMCTELRGKASWFLPFNKGYNDGAGNPPKTFAIVIDEAHSSQGGKTSAAMSKALSGKGNGDEEPDPEDEINDAIEKRMAARKMLTNASYFAFTATPKNRTLELFGEPLPPDPEGKIKHTPFDSYTMKQAVEERFILDVLKAYTPVESYYKLVKKIEDDPEFDTKKAKKKLRRYVESHDHAVRLKAEIMVDHFHDHVITPGKIGGHARAMVVTSGIPREWRTIRR